VAALFYHWSAKNPPPYGSVLNSQGQHQRYEFARRIRLPLLFWGQGSIDPWSESAITSLRFGREGPDPAEPAICPYEKIRAVRRVAEGKEAGDGRASTSHLQATSPLFLTVSATLEPHRHYVKIPQPFRTGRKKCGQPLRKARGAMILMTPSHLRFLTFFLASRPPVRLSRRQWLRTGVRWRGRGRGEKRRKEKKRRLLRVSSRDRRPRDVPAGRSCPCPRPETWEQRLCSAARPSATGAGAGGGGDGGDDGGGAGGRGGRVWRRSDRRPTRDRSIAFPRSAARFHRPASSSLGPPPPALPAPLGPSRRRRTDRSRNAASAGAERGAVASRPRELQE
jgi:hypothetical protein